MSAGSSRFHPARGAGVLALVLSVAACGGGERATSPEQILDGARRSLGPLDRIAAIQSIDAVAMGEGPGGQFRTRVLSTRDGRFRFEQLSGNGHTIAGLDSGGAWERSGDSLTAVDPVHLSFFRAHELHFLAFAPETRLRGTPTVHEETYRGHEAIGLHWPDPLGGEIILFYSRHDTLPLGYVVQDHANPKAPPVSIFFSEWSDVDSLRLFRGAVMSQGDQRFRYVYDSLTINTVADSVLSRARR